MLPLPVPRSQCRHRSMTPLRVDISQSPFRFNHLKRRVWSLLPRFMTIVMAAGLVKSILGAPDGNARSNSTGSASVFSVDLFPSSCMVGNVAYTTQLDCAFYTAKAAAISRSNSVTLVLGDNYYPTCAELVEPTGFYTVDIVGQSIRSSF